MRALEKRTLEKMIIVAVKEKKKKKVKVPVEIIIEAHFYEKRRRDPDNLYVKPILDGLVRSGLFDDDNGDIIDCLSLKSKIGQKCDSITINIKSLRKPRE